VDEHAAITGVERRRVTMRTSTWALLAAMFAAPGFAATITMTTSSDDLTANGNCTLREAVKAAQTNLAVDLCSAGSLAQADLILVPQEAVLELGEIEVVGDSGPLILRGATAGTPPSIHSLGGSPSRLFSLNTGANVTLLSLVLEVGFDDNSGGAVRASDVDLVARDVTFRSSFAPVGGGLEYSASGNHHLVLDRCRFTSNGASGENGEAQGGGARIFLGTGASGRIVDTEFAGNGAETAPGGFGAAGGGLYAEVTSASSLVIERSRFSLNRVDPQGTHGGEGSGAKLRASGIGARLVVVDSAFLGNNVVQPVGGDYTGALNAFVADGAELILDRLRLEDNDPGEPGRHLVLSAFGDATITASNLLLADGPANGLSVDCGDGDCRLGHATITGHGARAAFLQAFSAGEIRLENSILFGPHFVAAVGSVVVDASNLDDGTNPQFVNAAAGNYRLAAGSPAIDFGNAALASVGPYDLAHAPRVVGLDTDAGAFEFGALFADGFESGDRGAWSATLP
jgi:CSLREA domain-containing protein